MAAHQAKAKQKKAKKPAVAATAKGAKPKALRKGPSLPKKKPLVAAKHSAKPRPSATKRPLATTRPPTATRPLAKKAKHATQTRPVAKTKPLVKAQVKSAPRLEAITQAGKVQAHDMAKARLPLKGKPAPQEIAVPKPTQSAKQIAKQIAKQQAAKLTAKQKQDLRKGEQKPEDVEARRTRLKNLIKLGKERGFLTYSEINDHLPDDLVDAEQIESIITTFSDMGIQVYDVAPDAETLLISENAPAVVPDEDAEEEAEAALSTVDPEFGRTTDPVRMYMREMGSVELLTREGEIEIAKRIEDVLKHMITAISA
jgi:RNA polymerase primary sigma factor